MPQIITMMHQTCRNGIEDSFNNILRLRVRQQRYKTNNICVSLMEEKALMNLRA